MAGIPLMEVDVACLLENELRKLKLSEQTVLARRIFSDKPATLQDLGGTLGVGRERVRQIQAQAFFKASRIVEPEGQLNAVCAAIHEVIGFVLPLEVLLSSVPMLSRPVEVAECAAWRVIERLDKSFEVGDNWCACPSISVAKALTLDWLNRAIEANGVVKIDDLASLNPAFSRLSAKDWRFAWLQYCGFNTCSDEVSVK